MIRLLILYLVILVFLTLNPWLLPSSHSAIGFLTWDMIAHASAYGVLSTVLLMTFIRKDSSLTLTALIILACGSSGILLEYCQYWFTSNRQLSLHDALSNFTGALLGAIAFWSIRGGVFKHH